MEGFFEVFTSKELDSYPTVIKQAATLFSGHYGIWNPAHLPKQPPRSTPPTPDVAAGEELEAARKESDQHLLTLDPFLYRLVTRGSSKEPKSARVKSTPARLRRDVLPPQAESIYIRYLPLTSVPPDPDVDPIAHVCAVRWQHADRQVVWVSQLVVHESYRRRGIATRLLRKLRQPEDQVFGIMSSHPGAIQAGARGFGPGIGHIGEDGMTFMRGEARGIMASSPVPYVRQGKAVGSLYDWVGTKTDKMGMVSACDTGFFVDHDECNSALEITRRRGVDWPLGYFLEEGHEFLLVLQVE